MDMSTVSRHVDISTFLEMVVVYLGRPLLANMDEFLRSLLLYFSKILMFARFDNGQIQPQYEGKSATIYNNLSDRLISTYAQVCRKNHNIRALVSQIKTYAHFCKKKSENMRMFCFQKNPTHLQFFSLSKIKIYAHFGQKKETDFINLGLKHIFPEGVQIFGGGRAYLSAGPSVLRIFRDGISLTFSSQDFVENFDSKTNKSL